MCCLNSKLRNENAWFFWFKLKISNLNHSGSDSWNWMIRSTVLFWLFKKVLENFGFCLFQVEIRGNYHQFIFSWLYSGFIISILILIAENWNFIECLTFRLSQVQMGLLIPIIILVLYISMEHCSKVMFYWYWEHWCSNFVAYLPTCFELVGCLISYIYEVCMMLSLL